MGAPPRTWRRAGKPCEREDVPEVDERRTVHGDNREVVSLPPQCRHQGLGEKREVEAVHCGTPSAARTRGVRRARQRQ